MARNGHNCTRAVFHQHKVGCPNGNRFAGQWVNGVETCRNAFFLHRRHIGFCHFGIAAFVDESGQRWIVRSSLLCQRMTRGNGQVSRTHEGVGTRGIHRERLIAVFNVEGDFYAFRAANPVALHRFNGVWPVIQIIEIAQQFVSVSGDFNEPLWDLFALNFGIAAPAAAVDNLFVRENGLVVRAPVHRRGFLVHQAFFVQLGEEFLLPAVILWGTGRQLAAPVIAEAQHFELVFHVSDVVVGPRRRGRVVFHCRAFSRQTKRIPANRLQDVFTEHTLVARDHITDGVVTHVAHM